jgi:PAS domain S-box-containing protein
LPKNTEFINKPVTFWEKYRKQLTYGLIVLGFLFSVIVGLLRIISLKNSAEKKLLKSESRLGLALEGANLGLWDVDFIHADIFLSNQIAHLLGYSSPDDFSLRFDNWKSVFHPQDIDQLLEAFQMHEREVVPSFRSEIRLKTIDGKYKWFSMTGRIIERKEGKPARMIGILMNINFQKEFEEQLRIAKDKAEESDRLKSSFLANMSHEIRTPMNAILGFTDLIISENLEKEESEKYLKLIRSSGESLLGLINDIIDFSKIQSGQLTLRNETFDLNHLVDNIALVAKTLIERQHKKIEFVSEKGSTQENFFIVTDPLRLEQVLYNLVSNAIKFTHSGKILLKYKIIDAGTLRFSVKDTGKGVAPEYHDLIFERFRQVETPSTENSGGTGLGLAITKSLLSLMGGKITIQSELNQGATFTFTIHYKPAAVSPELSPDNNQGHSEVEG